MVYTDEEYNEMATMAIYNYYDGEYMKEYIQLNFTLAIKVFVENAKNTIKPIGVKSMSENGASITYSDQYERFSITSDVIALLPKKTNFKVW